MLSNFSQLFLRVPVDIPFVVITLSSRVFACTCLTRCCGNCMPIVCLAKVSPSAHYIESMDTKEIALYPLVPNPLQ